MELVMLGGALLAAGLGAGLIAGLLGVGGGIVVVPVLFHLFTGMGLDEAIRMKVAVGTSLATIVATAVSSARAHWQRGNVAPEFLRAYAPAIVLGVAVGTMVASSVRGGVLSGMFAMVALMVSAQFIFGNPRWRLGDAPPTKGPLRWAIGGVIGGVSAMMGIGGGTLTVPVMTAYGHSVHRAVGTASVVGFMIGVPGMLGFVIGGWGAANLPPFSLGYVNLLGAAFIIPASMLTAPLGARLAQRLDTVKLRRVFALFLLLTAGRMIYSLLG